MPDTLRSEPCAPASPVDTPQVFGERTVRGVPVPDGWEHVGWIDIVGNLWPVEPHPARNASDRPVFAAQDSGSSEAPRD